MPQWWAPPGEPISSAIVDASLEVGARAGIASLASCGSDHRECPSLGLSQPERLRIAERLCRQGDCAFLVGGKR